MIRIITFLSLLLLLSCTNESKKANSIENDEKKTNVCNCFSGNEGSYFFEKPNNCNVKDSLVILIPDTTSFHEDGFRTMMFNLYGDILIYLKEEKYSGRVLAYYDSNQKHLGLEVNTKDGIPDGKMTAFSFEGEKTIERYFEDGQLFVIPGKSKDIGNTNWSFNREVNEFDIDPDYLENQELSLFYSPDMKQEDILDYSTKPEEVFNSDTPLQVNGAVFSGAINYFSDTEGFDPLPVARLLFCNGFLEGTTTYYGDYDDYPYYFDRWVIHKEINYSSGIRAKNPPLDGFNIFRQSRYTDSNGDEIFNDINLSFRLINDTVQEGGLFEIIATNPHYYIVGGLKTNDTLEIEMVGVNDARQTSIDNAIANEERYTVKFLVEGTTLKYIGKKRKDCNYCIPNLLLNKYKNPNDKSTECTNDPISNYILEKITASYAENTTDSLKTFIQVHDKDESNSVIMTITAPAEGGLDSWALGELIFVDSTINSYEFKILDDLKKHPLHKVIFNIPEGGLTTVTVIDYADNYTINYISEK